MPRWAAGLRNKGVGAVPDTDFSQFAEKSVLIRTVLSHLEPIALPARPIRREPLPGPAGKGGSIRGLHASATLAGGPVGRAPARCDHATAGASTRNRWIFGPLFERHGRGENQ